MLLSSLISQKNRTQYIKSTLLVVAASPSPYYEQVHQQWDHQTWQTEHWQGR